MIFKRKYRKLNYDEEVVVFLIFKSVVLWGVFMVLLLNMRY